MQTRNSGAFGIGLGIVGGIVGAFFGNPMLGFKLGMMAGSILFQPKMDDKANVIKPSDVQVPTCELGRPIPVFYGTFGPISGNVVYFGNKKKIAHTMEPEDAGKGGGAPTQSTTYYTWSVDFCMVLGWGPGTVLRCYSGGKEISLDKFRIYDGTQTTSDAIFDRQPRKPVYKGLMLVCAEQYDLGQSGQFPIFQFDVARKSAIPSRGTALWAGSSIPAAGGIDAYGDSLYVGGGSSTTVPVVNIYDPWVWRDDTVPATIPSAASAMAVSPTRAFMLEWTASPLKVYCYTRSNMAYGSTIDLTGTASIIYAIRCSESTLFVCYLSTGGSLILRRYNLTDLSLRDSLTITGVSAGRVITDIAISPTNFYLADSANNRVWDVPRSTLAATGRTLAGGTAYGVTIDPAGNIWVAAGGASVYVYTPAWSLSATVTHASITAARRVRHFLNRHMVVVLNKTGDAGSIAVLSSGQLTTDVDQGGGKTAPDFAFERLWTVASTTTDITKLAASENLVAVVEKPSDDIYIYSPTGDLINTITGTFADVAINDLGVYCAGASNVVSFYANGLGAADTRTISADCGSSYLVQIACGNESPGGARKLYVLYRDATYTIFNIAIYTLPANGQVSTATFVGTMRTINGPFITNEVAPSSLSASRDGLGLLMTRSGAAWHYDIPSAYWTKIKGPGNQLKDTCWIHDTPRFITCKTTKIIANGGTGVPSKEFLDAARITALNEVVYAGGRIYAADKVGTTGQSRILVYVTEDHPLSTVRELLPNEISYDLMTNTAYGAGISPTSIDRTGEPLVASYSSRHDITLAPQYDTQITVTDFLEQLCTHHNGFIRVLAGKVSHGQFYYDPFDNDCTFAEIAAKSDTFGDGSIGAQWIPGPNTADQVESGGVLTLSPEANETAYIDQAALTYGAFDLQVDFASFSVTSGGAAAYGKAIINFYIDENNYALIGREKTSTINRYAIAVVTGGSGNSATANSSDASGKFRLVRKGQTIYGYYHNGTTWVLIGSFGGFSALGGTARLYASSDAGVTTSVQLDNYKHYESPDAIYPEHIVTAIDAATGGSSENQNPVVVSTGGSRDRPNQVLVEFSRKYVANMPDTIAKAADIVDVANNTLVSMTFRLPGIRRSTPARFLANLFLMRSIAQQDTIQFEVGWQHEIIAGNLYWLTYPIKELDHVPVRAVTVEVTEAGTRKVTAIREEDIYDPDIYADDLTITPTPLRPIYPGDVENITAILMAPEYSAPLDYDLDFFYTRPTNDSWAGAALYQAYAETGDYALKITSPLYAIQGTVAGVGGTTTKYIDVTLYTDDDLASIAAIVSMFENLVYINAHYIQFTTATLQSGTTWRLTGLIYDPNTTPVSNSYGSTATGQSADFYARRPMTLDIPDADLGVPLWFKIASINTDNNIQPLSDVDPISVTVPARNTIPAIGTYTEGTPAALVGDAVHFEKSDNKYYRADPFYRDNVVGIKDGNNVIVQRGPARQVQGLTDNGEYYLKCPAIAEQDYHTGCTYNAAWALNSTWDMIAQMFTVPTSKVLVGAKLWIYRSHDAPDPKMKIYCELRSDDGAGGPSATVLARSEWLPTRDFKHVDSTYFPVYFRFFEYYKLATGTTYHMVITADIPEGTTWSYTNTVTVYGSQGFLANVHMHTAKSKRIGGSGIWYGDATYPDADIAMALYLADVDDTSSANITTTHPFDTADWAHIMGMLPIHTVGIAQSANEMTVDIDRSWPEVIFRDYQTTWSTNAEEPDGAKNLIASFDLLNADKVLMLYHTWKVTDDVSFTWRAKLNGVTGTQYSDSGKDAPFDNWPSVQVWNRSDLQLSARKYFYIELASALGTPSCGKVQILKAGKSGPAGQALVNTVPEGGAQGQVLVKSTGNSFDADWQTLVPTGGATGQLLAKKSATDLDTEWKTPTDLVALMCSTDTVATAPSSGATHYIGGSYADKHDVTFDEQAIYLPFAGTIVKAMLIMEYNNTPDSGVNWTTYIRVNDSTDTTVQTTQRLSSSPWKWQNASLNISVSAGDRIAFKSVVPSMTTRPNYINYRGVILIRPT